MMKYVSQLLENEEYKGALEKIGACERERVYCRHDFTHLMDVARLMWQRVLEEHVKLDKEQVYLAALLHDIGRVREYEEGISHDTAGKELAGEILVHIGYPPGPAEDILEAIGRHREDEGGPLLLGALLRDADKKSRPCFYCAAADRCKWSQDERNTEKSWQ